MTRDRDTLLRINQCFEGPEVFIEQVYRKNAVFRSLCKDYRECAEALERWNQSESEVAVERQMEYAEMLQELKQEIQDWLEAVEQQRGTTKGMSKN